MEIKFRLKRTLSWDWGICFVDSLLVFVALFWGALLLPAPVYLFVSAHVAELNVGAMAVLFLLTLLFVPSVPDRHQTACRTASLVNTGWLAYSLVLGPFFLCRYHGLPPSSLKESYYYSYIASYAGASFACALGNGAFILYLWRKTT